MSKEVLSLKKLEKASKEAIKRDIKLLKELAKH